MIVYCDPHGYGRIHQDIAAMPLPRSMNLARQTREHETAFRGGTGCERGSTNHSPTEDQLSVILVSTSRSEASCPEAQSIANVACDLEEYAEVLYPY